MVSISRSWKDCLFAQTSGSHIKCLCEKPSVQVEVEGEGEKEKETQ